MINKVTLVGNLGKDPDIRTTQGGDDVATFSVATSETWKDKQTGEKKEATEWHRVVVFGGLARVIRDYAQKGTRLYIEGKLKTRKWQDQSGQDKYTTEVVVSGFGGIIKLLSNTRESHQQTQHEQQKQDGYQPDNFDDDIPF